MPNIFAYVVFLGYPLIAWVLFRRLPLPAMVAATIVAGYLFLPTRVGFDPPLLPALDRKFMPCLTAILLIYLRNKAQEANRFAPAAPSKDRVLQGLLPKNPVILGLFGLFISGAIMTVMVNRQPVNYGDRTLPALRFYDIGSDILSILIVLMPFFLARKYLATTRAHLQLLIVLSVAALIYSLPTLYEVRMSPQLNNIVYGFFPTSWVQHLRGGGFRPVVFLDHGLNLGIFLTMSIIASAILVRYVPRRWMIIFLGATVWLLGTLFLTKTFGAFLIAVALLPVAFLMPARLQMLGAGLLMVLVLLFPMLRGAGMVPVDRVVEFAQGIDEQRAASLRFRLQNEEILLEKAKARPLFGWGGWGRSRVFNEDGQDISTTDGYWLISLGVGGWTRYIAEFGLLSAAMLMLAFSWRRGRIELPTAGLCLVMVANLIDLIPNAGISTISWLVAGAISGRLEVRQEREEEAGASEPGPVPNVPRYSRQSGPPKVRERPSRSVDAEVRAHLAGRGQETRSR